MNKEIKHITQDELVREISYNTPHTMKVIKDVLNGLEQVIIQEAISTTPTSSVKIKLFKGFFISVKYSDGKNFNKGITKNNNFEPFPKIKIEISDNLKTKLKSLYKYNKLLL